MKYITRIAICGVCSVLISMPCFAQHQSNPPSQSAIARSQYCMDFVRVLQISVGALSTNMSSPQAVLKEIDEKGAFPHLTERDKKKAINEGFFNPAFAPLVGNSPDFVSVVLTQCNNYWKPLRTYQPLK